MMIRDVGGYTLFGAKPMHMFNFYKPFSISKSEFFFSSIRPNNLRIYRDWKTWQKYQHLLEKSEFVFWAEKNPCWEKRSIPDNPSVSIFFIHKKELEKAINAHLKDFQKVLKRQNIACEELLLETKDKSFFNEVLRGHEGLIGILFGYGRDNAWLFEEKMHGKTVPLSSLWEKELYEHFLMRRSCFIWSFFGICSNEFSQILDYPSFAADPNSDETKQLKEKYLATREKILSYYKNKDFLEATLSILINGAP